MRPALALSALLLAACGSNPYAPLASAKEIVIDVPQCEFCAASKIRVTARADGSFLYQNVWSKPEASGTSPRVAEAMKALGALGSSAGASIDAKQMPQGFLVSVGPDYELKVDPSTKYPIELVASLNSIFGVADAAAAHHNRALGIALRAKRLARAEVILDGFGRCGFDASFANDGEARVRFWRPGALRTPIETLAVPFDSIASLVRIYGLESLWDRYPIHWQDVAAANVVLDYGGTTKRISAPDLSSAPVALGDFTAAVGGVLASRTDLDICRTRL